MLCDAVKYAKVTGQTQIREELECDEINKTKPKNERHSKPKLKRKSLDFDNDCIDEDGFRYVEYEYGTSDDLF